ncbi:MAG: hypothetical protein K9L32_11730, partial [Chromatiaceae bacterium]|nr:hypothetical protein [Chromatiaceae bacterium]
TGLQAGSEVHAESLSASVHRLQLPSASGSEQVRGDWMTRGDEQLAALTLAPSNEQERIELERRMIEQALAASQGKVSGPGGAAARLGLKPTTLASRIKRYGIQKP